MRRLLAGLGLLLAFPLFAQDTSYVYESEHYRVRSYVSVEQAEQLAVQLEALAVLYNDFFHFDLDDLGHKLRVQVFADKAGFDTYVSRLIGETRSEFVYLHYSDATRSELVGFASDDKAVAASVPHQAFIQFFRAYVANPPLWLREGFAVYFEATEYDDNFKAAVNRENLSWLETIKDILFGDRAAEALSPEQILASNVETAKRNIEVFYPESWALVNYLLNSTIKAHNRILWDSIAALKPNASLEENSANVVKAAFQWVPQEDLFESFVTYFDQKLTYKELIEAGVAAYDTKNLGAAESYFVQAIDRRDDSFVPHYYLGLINYDRGNFDLAKYNYQTALDMGADPALTLYALGVNAFAGNVYEEAETFLQQSSELDPENFGDKVAQILERIQN